MLIYLSLIMYISLQRYNISCKDCANFYEKFPLNKLKRFGGMEKNIYLCTVKNASEGLKRALNAKSAKNEGLKN